MVRRRRSRPRCPAPVTRPRRRAGTGFRAGARRRLVRLVPDGRGVVYVAGDGALWSCSRSVRSRGGSGGSAEGEPAGAQAPCISADGMTVAFMVDQRHIVVRPDRGSDRPPCSPQTSVRTSASTPCSHPTARWSRSRAGRCPTCPGTARRGSRSPPTGRGHSTAAPGSGAHAVQQPGFDPDGRPIEIRDDTGWLNVWVAGRPLLGDGGERSEHAGPTWGPRPAHVGREPRRRARGVRPQRARLRSPVRRRRRDGRGRRSRSRGPRPAVVAGHPARRPAHGGPHADRDRRLRARRRHADAAGSSPPRAHPAGPTTAT